MEVPVDKPLTLEDLRRPQNKSGWYGVCWGGIGKHKRKPWLARFCLRKIAVYLGYFRQAITAAKAVLRALLTIGGFPRQYPGRINRTCKFGHIKFAKNVNKWGQCIPCKSEKERTYIRTCPQCGTVGQRVLRKTHGWELCPACQAAVFQEAA